MTNDQADRTRPRDRRALRRIRPGGRGRDRAGEAIALARRVGVTSAPTVYADSVIVGSSIGDNQRVDEPRGTVRAFDVRTGLAVGLGPDPRRADDPAAVSWGEGWRRARAPPNVCTDVGRCGAPPRCSLPTTSPSPISPRRPAAGRQSLRQLRSGAERRHLGKRV